MLSFGIIITDYEYKGFSLQKTELMLHDSLWIDITAPNKSDLKQLAADHALPEKLLFNCLDPDYLPYVELGPDFKFIVFRVSEKGASDIADTIQELTTKIAVFIKDKLVITIHRLNLSEIEQIKNKVENEKSKPVTIPYFLRFLFEEVIQSYDQTLVQLENKADIFEENIFKNRHAKELMKTGFYIKRKASAYKKVIKFTQDLYLTLQTNYPMPNASFLKERLARFLFYSEDVFENIQSLLNLHLSIESHKINEASFRTNEIMRVLTVLTLFFLPLNFIAGVYGMNFEVIPLAKHPEGFWISIAIMFLVCILLLGYVVKKGWLSDRNPNN